MFAALRRRMQSWMRPRQAETLPARLDRHRIYVLPTASGLFFALMIATMGLGALNFNNNPALLLAGELEGPLNSLPERLVRTVLRVWDDPDIGPTLRSFLDGIVRDVVFLGESARCYIGLAGGPEIMATTSAEGMARGEIPSRGARVRFGWQTDSAIVFPAGGK